MLVDLFFTVFGPFYALHIAGKLKKLNSDPAASKMAEGTTDERQSDKIYMSNTFSFKSAQKCYKRFVNTTFNDYMLGNVSVSLDKWFNQNGIKDAKKVAIAVPINARPPPTNLKNLKLGNHLMGYKMELPIRPDLESAIAETKKSFWSNFSPAIINSFYKLSDIFRYAPQKMVDQATADALEGIGLCFSNIPISREEATLCGRKLQDCGFWTHNQMNIKLLVICTTYQDKIKLCYSASQSMKMDPKGLIKCIEDSLNEEFEQFAKAD